DGFLSVRRLNRRLNSLALQFPGAAFHKRIEVTLELAERLSCFHTRDSLEPLGDVPANVFVLIFEKGGDLLDVFVREQVTREAQRVSMLLVVERVSTRNFVDQLAGDGKVFFGPIRPIEFGRKFVRVKELAAFDVFDRGPKEVLWRAEHQARRVIVTDQDDITSERRLAAQAYRIGVVVLHKRKVAPECVEESGNPIILQGGFQGEQFDRGSRAFRTRPGLPAITGQIAAADRFRDREPQLRVRLSERSLRRWLPRLDLELLQEVLKCRFPRHAGLLSPMLKGPNLLLNRPAYRRRPDACQHMSVSAKCNQNP